MTRTPFRELVRCSADAGFDGVSAWKRTYDRAVTKEGLAPADLGHVVRDAGQRVFAVEGVFDWVDQEAGAGPSAQEQEFYAMADAFEASAIVAAHETPTPLDVDLATERFGALCARAAERGLDVMLEAIAMGGLNCLADADAIVAGAGPPNGGLLVDMWHRARGICPLLDVATLGAPVLAVQLADAPAAPTVPDLWEETMFHRLLPGEGDGGVVDALATLLAQQRLSPLPVGLEVFVDPGDPPDHGATSRTVKSIVDRAVADAFARVASWAQ